jgi:hypothetical protein
MKRFKCRRRHFVRSAASRGGFCSGTPSIYIAGLAIYAKRSTYLFIRLMLRTPFIVHPAGGAISGILRNTAAITILRGRFSSN